MAKREKKMLKRCIVDLLLALDTLIMILCRLAISTVGSYSNDWKIALVISIVLFVALIIAQIANYSKFIKRVFTVHIPQLIKQK